MCASKWQFVFISTPTTGREVCQRSWPSLSLKILHIMHIPSRRRRPLCINKDSVVRSLRELSKNQWWSVFFQVLSINLCCRQKHLLTCDRLVWQKGKNVKCFICVTLKKMLKLFTVYKTNNFDGISLIFFEVHFHPILSYY